MFNSLFCFYYLFFLFFLFLSFFSKIEYLGLILSFDLFVFSSIVVRFESGLQKNILSSFNLVLV